MNQLDNSSNTEHRFRIYQVAISSLKSDKTTVVETTKTILTRAVNELEGDDVLQQLSVMDLFANVAIVSAVAAQFVGEVGLTQRVYDLMQKCKDEPDGGFLYPACIKFFGSLSYCYPEAITAYPAFLPAVIDQISMFDRLDASTRLLAFDTFAHIAHKQEAKTKIQGILGTEGLKRTLSHFGAACASGPVDLRTRHIDALAVMFEHGEETQLSNWFKELGDGFPHFSAVSVSKPFKDLKIALLRLFHAVLSREFGKQTYIPMAEFSEWLLNRKSEPDWECAQLKEDLIKRLIDSPSAFISPEFRQKLRDYFGPAEAQLNVAWIYDLLDTKPEGIMWRGRRQQNDQPDNWNGTWNRNQMSKQSNDRGNPFCSKSDDKQKSEEKLAEEYECCSDGEKGKRPIERWDVSRMHDVDAKQNQNRDFTRLIDDERSLTLNDPVTLGKFNPWLPAYANQLHPYLIIGKKREILNSERNCEAKWKYTGKLWPLEYNVDYEKLEHHRAQQKKVAPTDEEFKRFWKMNEERCKAELDLEIAVINSDRLIIRFLVKEIKNMNQLAKIASSSSDSEDVYIHKKRLAKRICMELWFDLFEDLPTMAAFIYCVQKAAEDAIPEDIPYVDIAEFEATLHAVICREFPEDAKKCHHSPRDIWNVFGLTREDALKCGLLLACKIDASIWIRPHQLLFEQLVFTSSDRILEGCLYNLLSRFSDDYAVDFEQIKQA
ncbi:hypothetical protein WR25_17843 [Diploscapter pachys]|uniref:26S proteasome non-ATPase regulatory subunit 5 n=1 Tax=Diploscapter pachys TaxID=2018661 RepID=A0A2A2JMQ6_9BILA|nr:hypothetical protein WR25_17843 [Diploscapter pachys]